MYGVRDTLYGVRDTLLVWETHCKETWRKFVVHVTEHRDKFLLIKPTRCTNFSNLSMEWKFTRFGHFLCPSSGVFHCTHNIGICHTCLLTACLHDISHCSVYSEKLLLMDRRTVRNTEFHFKNKFEKISASSWFYYKKLMNVFWDFTFCRLAKSCIKIYMRNT